MKKHKIVPELKEQIINRIKNEGVSVSQAAKDHGVSDVTIYSWIAKKVDGAPPLAENIKLKRENEQLFKLVGEMMVMSALMNVIHNNPRPMVFHPDNGSEYNSEIFIEALQNLNINISRSAPGCPWENGYQELFHSQFKVDFGDPARFNTLLKMLTNQFALLTSKRHNLANRICV